MITYDIISNIVDDRIYIIKANLHGLFNIKQLSNYVIDYYIEKTRFSRTVDNLDSLAMSIESLESKKLIENKHKLIFAANKNKSDSSTKSFISFEIIKESQYTNTLKINMNRHSRITVQQFNVDITDINVDLNILKNKIDMDIERYNFSNSEETYKKIILFSDKFLIKWNIDLKNLVEMAKDVEMFVDEIDSISDANMDNYMENDNKYIDNKKMDLNFIKKDFRDSYILPVHNLFKETQKENLDFLRSLPLFQAIYANDPDQVFKLSNNLKEQYGKLKVSALMFACSRFYGFKNNEEPDKNIKIIRILLIRGSDKNQTDIFKYTALDYIKNGPLIFGHKPCTLTIEKDIRDLFYNQDHKTEIKTNDDWNIIKKNK